MLMRALAFALCLTATSCGSKPIARDPSGKLSVAARCAPETLTDTLKAHPEATLIVAFDASNRAILAATDAAKRPARPYAVVIGEAPDAREELLDAVIVGDSGAAAAIDLALLACNGVAPPRQPIEIGCRTITAANRAAGGSMRAGPGDAFLAMTRMQHQKVLTTQPATDENHQVGILQTHPQDPEQQRIRREANAAASRYPQLTPVAIGSQAGGDLAMQARQLIARGCRAIILASRDPKQSQRVLAVAETAPDGRVPVIVLDPLLRNHGTCVIGCSPKSLGQAAATVVQGLLPDGGTIVTCFTPSGVAPIGPTSGMRAVAFCQVMNLPAKQLLER